MDKIKKCRITGYKEQRIGVPIGVVDKNGNDIMTGDRIMFHDSECIVLWNKYHGQYWAYLDYSKWYGDNQYDCDSYGKGYAIPMDNGAKMQMTKIVGVEP